MAQAARTARGRGQVIVQLPHRCEPRCKRALFPPDIGLSLKNALRLELQEVHVQSRGSS